MFASPWDAHPFAEYSQPMRIPLATRSERIDPTVKVLTHEYSYTITVSAPSGFELGEVKGSALDQCSLVVVGSLVEPATTYEYVSKCQARVYGSPHGRCLLGVLPAGTVYFEAGHRRTADGSPWRTTVKKMPGSSTTVTWRLCPWGGQRKGTGSASTSHCHRTPCQDGQR